MSMSNFNTNNSLNVDRSFEHQENEMIKGTGNFSKLMKIILISAVALAVVSGIIVLAVVLSKNKHNGNHVNYIDESTTSSQNIKHLKQIMLMYQQMLRNQQKLT